MINLDNFIGLKKNIKKYIEKFNNIKYFKTIMITVMFSVLLMTVFLVYDNKPTNNVVRNKVKIEAFSMENNSSKKLDMRKQDMILEDISNVKSDVNDILKVEIPVYSVRVDGKELAIFKTENEAKKLLDDIIKPFIEDNEDIEIEDVRFKENVEIIERLGNISEFDDNPEYEELLYYITKGTSETRIHKVEKGENYWVISDKYNIKPDDLIKANPGVKPERLQIGQEISLVVPKPLITVVTTEIKEYNEYIDFETKYEDTNVLYKGEYRVKKSGEKGEREVKAKIVKENGIEINRDILEEKIIKEPITKVVLKGTKNPPPRIGTGKLDKPTSRGVITSPFGWRWGRRHTGIDIGIPIGTDIKAADGGKVIFSGTKGGYGKCIIIDHGANIQTLYAHNSKLLVKKGDKVYKGQTIAKSGNTGNSTGPHLHFEVRKNGTPVNPINYIKY